MFDSRSIIHNDQENQTYLAETGTTRAIHGYLLLRKLPATTETHLDASPRSQTGQLLGGRVDTGGRPE